MTGARESAGRSAWWSDAAVVAALVVVGGGCAPLGGVDDGTSLSRGNTSRGRIVNAAVLPVRGEGYLVPPTWARRGLNHGTEELVGLVVRAGRRLAREMPGVVLYVADLSPRTGGPSAWHRSHQSGRDVDLLFIARDDEGRLAAPPAAMIKYDATGAGDVRDEAGSAVPRRRFDVAANWRVVRALLDDPVAEVQYIFLAAPLRDLLLVHAVERGEPSDVLERAALVLAQPSDSLPHDDHMHVRILCPPSDRGLGCEDRGPLRWTKKGYKYEVFAASGGASGDELSGLSGWSTAQSPARGGWAAMMCPLTSVRLTRVLW